MATRFGIALLLAVLSGCASGAAPPGGATGADRRGRAPRAAAEAGPAPLAAAELARVPSVTYGPYLGVGGGGALAVWAAQSGSERKFSAVPLSPQGRPLTPARVIGSAPDEIGLMAVYPLQSGYALAYTRRAANAESLEVACLGAKGDFAGTASALGPVSGRGIWVEATRGSAGVLLFSAGRVEDAQRRAEISVVPLDAKCRPGERSTLTRDALAWQAIPFGKGALLSVVRPGEGGAPVLEAWLLDAQGKPQFTTRVSAPGAGLDVDAMAVGDRAIIAWTQEHALEPRIQSAVVSADGKLARPAEALTPAEGEQTLVRLVPPLRAGQPGFAVWENVGTGGAVRKLELSAVDADGRVAGPRARLEYAGNDGGVPELAATARGVAALTLAPACRRGGRCDAASLAPVFVELSTDLSPIAIEPLRLEPLAGKAAEVGFALDCSAEGCLSIAALASSPAPVFAVELRSKSNAWRAPLSLVDSTTTPRVLEHEALSRVDSLAAFAIERVADIDVLATITDFDPTTPWQRLKKPAPDGRFEPLRAQVAVERLGSAGNPTQPFKVSPVSLRAHSLGNVALAPGDPARGDLLLVWAGIDAGEPQIFLTLLTKGGERIGQRMLTRKKGDLGDIVASWVGDGWIVAWVDERFGDPEVFATKVDPKLNRATPEQRITEAAGAATDLALSADSSGVRVAWSDARGAELPGHADVYTAVLRRRDAAREGAELRLAATRAHSFSPALSAFRGGFAAAWVERPEEGAEAGSIALVMIAPDGSVSPIAPVRTPEGEPRSIALSCGDSACRLASVLERANAAELAAGSWDGASPAALRRVLSIAGNAGAAVPPAIRGDTVFFADAAARSARVRRARLAW